MAEKKKTAKVSAAKGSKTGDNYRCEVCGLSLVVDEPCGCTACEVVCCGKPMKKSGSRNAC